jgi:hypothetical protein
MEFIICFYQISREETVWIFRIAIKSGRIHLPGNRWNRSTGLELSEFYRDGTQKNLSKNAQPHQYDYRPI